MPDINHTNWMARAIELAQQGRGHVEPNPMVGCVLVQNQQVVGEGWHQQFGGPHAEIEALRQADTNAKGSTAYVSLEPCCFQGKTGPCSQALIQAQVAKVVVGCTDPNPRVAGQGIAELQAAGIEVELQEDNQQALDLIALFAKLTTKNQPWVIAKWAMTLDGKIATHSGSSQWISGEASRAVVHQVRGQVDAILVGRGTVLADDPQLTARPIGPRTALRIVLDSSASLFTSSRLVQSAREIPLLVAVADSAPDEKRHQLESLGVEIFELKGDTRQIQMQSLLDELGQRKMTNVLVEGGAQILGTFLDLQAIDEVHAFIAPKLIGGQSAPAAIAGQGLAEMSSAITLRNIAVSTLESDVHVHGLVSR